MFPSNCIESLQCVGVVNETGSAVPQNWWWQNGATSPVCSDRLYEQCAVHRQVE